MADAQLSGTVILAYPREGIDEFIPRLRVVVPEVEVHVVPYVGKFGQHIRGTERIDELTDERRALWGQAEVVLALDLPKGIDELAPNLRWVQAIGAGIDHLHDCGLPDAVVVTNAAGVAALPIAEFVIARLLEVWKRLGDLDALQREHTWKPTFGRVFDGSTVGVVGLGAIGGEVARLARALAPTRSGSGAATSRATPHPSPTSCSAPIPCTTSWHGATPWCSARRQRPTPRACSTLPRSRR